MAEVDPNDDSIWRWVLHHYRYDSERRERRNVVVAAYSNEAEFDDALATYGRRIHDEITAGYRDRKEHVGGVIWHPGHHAEQAYGRTVRKATQRGADPRGLPLKGKLPSNIGIFGWDADGATWSLEGEESPTPPAGDA